MKRSYRFDLIVYTVILLMLCFAWGCKDSSDKNPTEKPVTTEYPPVPRMWVPMKSGIKYKDWYESGKPATGTASKHSLLSAELRPGTEAQSILCPINNVEHFLNSFDETVKYIRIYLAAYKKDVGGEIPEDNDKRLTLILAPADRRDGGLIIWVEKKWVY
jgi:hypothetical protein